MSEEEIIKKANLIIENHREIDKMMVIEMVDLVQGLLNLYQAEKEKNKELENADLTTVYMNGFYDGEKKWKDKIKVSIDELTKNEDITNGRVMYSSEKAILKRLLKGE